MYIEQKTWIQVSLFINSSTAENNIFEYQEKGHQSKTIVNLALMP